MLCSFTEEILCARKEKPERDTLCVSEAFSASRAQKRPVKPHGFLSQAAYAVFFLAFSTVVFYNKGRNEVLL